ncbi:HesA/MoeB/ThiF family protein [Streptomyces sp. NBC_01465]|uniref:HesA/MoeB/ThiF family protein n=1 Tax=Streptomyces sp. NBC_01465 TaxID=2903878 RepID=UPI002E313FE1|nr:ThiF family adenylyltransferase [Streptomyces sp. NBC_01465]
MAKNVGSLRRPRIKPEHRAYRTVDGHVRIGSVIHGIGSEILDEQGWVWSLVQNLDGSRTPQAVASEVLRCHPALENEDVLQAMADLWEAGFLDDAAPPPPDLSTREQTRYSRGVPLLRWMDLSPRESPWDAQLALRQAKVLLIGTGGTGGSAAQALVASGVGLMHCVDPDTVELSNLNRQLLYRERHIGEPKVRIAVEDLRALNSDVVVTGEQCTVGSPADFSALLPGYDVMLLAADRPTDIRRWANRACLDAGVPWAVAGYRGPLVTVGVHVPGRGGCWECLRTGEVERRDLRLGPDQDESAASPRMPWNPANAVTAGLSGSLLAHAAVALLTGIPRMEPGVRYGINLMTPGEPVLDRFPRRPDCPACGDDRRGGDRP